MDPINSHQTLFEPLNSWWRGARAAHYWVLAVTCSTLLLLGLWGGPTPHL